MLQSTHANPLFMLSSLFFFNDTATTEIYTLSLHDALPICLYELPFHLNVSAFYNARQGYPFERGILSPSRANGGNTDRKSTRLNSSHSQISYAVFCLKKKNTTASSWTPPHPTPLRIPQSAC